MPTPAELHRIFNMMPNETLKSLYDNLDLTTVVQISKIGGIPSTTPGFGDSDDLTPMTQKEAKYFMKKHFVYDLINWIQTDTIPNRAYLAEIRLKAAKVYKQRPDLKGVIHRACRDLDADDADRLSDLDLIEALYFLNGFDSFDPTDVKVNTIAYPDDPDYNGPFIEITKGFRYIQMSHIRDLDLQGRPYLMHVMWRDLEPGNEEEYRENMSNYDWGQDFLARFPVACNSTLRYTGGSQVLGSVDTKREIQY
jgi:hypothetical protein